MKVTVDAAMRARDVSRPRPEHEAAAADSPAVPRPVAARRPVPAAPPAGTREPAKPAGAEPAEPPAGPRGRRRVRRRRPHRH